VEQIRWNYFDAHCVVGRHCKLQAGGLHTAEELPEEMDHYDTAEGLVVDSLSRENHPFEGNRRVLETTARRPRLHPAWASLPPGTDEQYGNDYAAEAVRLHPDRFVGFTLLKPHRGRDGILRELERCARLGLRGVKLIPYYQGYPEEGPLIDVAARWAHERKQIILDHHWGSPAQMERLLKTYPNACLITGHCTAAYAALMKRFADLFVCSCPLIGPGAFEEIVEKIGAHRLLFGSDLQDLPIAWGLGADPFLAAAGRVEAAHPRRKPAENPRTIQPQPVSGPEGSS
jgi:hypothetical protein